MHWKNWRTLCLPLDFVFLCNYLGLSWWWARVLFWAKTWGPNDTRVPLRTEDGWPCGKARQNKDDIIAQYLQDRHATYFRRAEDFVGAEMSKLVHLTNLIVIGYISWLNPVFECISLEKGLPETGAPFIVSFEKCNSTKHVLHWSNTLKQPISIPFYVIALTQRLFGAQLTTVLAVAFFVWLKCRCHWMETKSPGLPWWWPVQQCTSNID